MSILITILTTLGFPRIELAESVGRRGYSGGAAFRAGERGLLLGFTLLHGEKGITLVAVLMGEDDIAILFSFTRSYFRWTPRDRTSACVF